MLRAKNELVAEYQKLLTANESLTSVKRAIKLVWRALGARVRPTPNGVAFESSNHDRPTLDVQLRKAIDRIGPLSVPSGREVGGDEHLQTPEQQKLRTVAVESTVALKVVHAISALPETGLGEGRFSLLVDSCILLAHHAYFALLPKLGEAALSTERQLLLAAIREFAESLPRASDRFALLALCFDAVGAPQNATDARRAVLAATPSDAHEFMTALQSAWSSLVERGMADDALDLLLENYPRVPRRDLDEVGDLIRQTFRWRKN